ncbi:MAG TPA: hypothetical protein VFE47_09850 [Tepidisphaeraceae bacterium]|jgi:hypothetical protein|nr:hypothetical protein [Tepidisphaeraceae bacterium]
MNRSFLVAISMAFAVGLFLCPPLEAKSSSSGGQSLSDGGVHGQIQSVTTSNFSVGQHAGHGRRHRARVKPIVVHYNPDTVLMTVDGVAVKTLDVAVTGKYVSVYGTMTNGVLEATTVAVTSTAPAHARRRKSASK